MYSNTDHVARAAGVENDAEQDDTLILLFMCCHPALSPSSAIALTLRAVGGLTTREIANAFLVPEATMAQRIGRAKQSIKASGVPFNMPDATERTERLRAVLHVLYLIFNEGYSSSIGPDLQRRDLANEAIRLTRAVHHLLPHDGEVAGLLALMILTDARRLVRTGPEGELIPLDKQDPPYGTGKPSLRASHSSARPSPAARLALTSCRPRLPLSTTRPHAPRIPTGPRSWLCMACSDASPTIPW